MKISNVYLHEFMRKKKRHRKELAGSDGELRVNGGGGRERKRTDFLRLCASA